MKSSFKETRLLRSPTGQRPKMKKFVFGCPFYSYVEFGKRVPCLSSHGIGEHRPTRLVHTAAFCLSVLQREGRLNSSLVERRTHDRQVASSNPGRSGGRIFFFPELTLYADSYSVSVPLPRYRNSE